VRVARKLALFLPLAALVVVAGFVRLPLYAIGPGPAREVEPLIRVTGHPEYRSEGRFVMTSIRFGEVTAVGAVLAWLDPSRSVVTRDALFAPGETGRQEERRTVSQMDQSKVDAIYVVLSRLTDYPKDHGPGALVEGVLPGCSAAGRLRPGDLILAIDGERIAGQAEASAVIEGAPSGQTLRFEVRDDGKATEVDLVRRPCGGRGEPLVGVTLIDNFPFRVSISSGGIGGPSAGLMWALGLYDLLTPGDLTGGRTIAGTGQIDLHGRVYPIGGIGEKIAGAADTGAEVFLVPRDNLEAARVGGAEGMELVPVSTIDDALAYLERTA